MPQLGEKSRSTCFWIAAPISDRSANGNCVEFETRATWFTVHILLSALQNRRRMNRRVWAFVRLRAGLEFDLRHRMNFPGSLGFQAGWTDRACQVIDVEEQRTLNAHGNRRREFPIGDSNRLIHEELLKRVPRDFELC